MIVERKIFDLGLEQRNQYWHNLPLPFYERLKNCWSGIFGWEIDKMRGQFNKYFICFTLSASLLKISKQQHCQLLFWDFFGQSDLQGRRTTNLLSGQEFWMHRCSSMRNPKTQSPEHHSENPRCWTNQGSDFYYWTTRQKGIIL